MKNADAIKNPLRLLGLLIIMTLLCASCQKNNSNSKKIPKVAPTKTVEVFQETSRDLGTLQDRGVNGYFEPNSEIGFTGKVHIKWKIGDIIGSKNLPDFYAIGELLAGKEFGEWKVWHKNGNLEYIGSFISGNKVGEWEAWHKNGRKKYEINYNNNSEVISEKFWNIKGEPVGSRKEAEQFISGFPESL